MRTMMFFCAVISSLLNVQSMFAECIETEKAETLQRAFQRACVQCYAIEGRYPPSVSYLEENYGIQINEEQFETFYIGFAANVMPDITVVPVHSRESEGHS